jgi:hypothetical protein
MIAVFAVSLPFAQPACLLTVALNISHVRGEALLHLEASQGFGFVEGHFEFRLSKWAAVHMHDDLLAKAIPFGLKPSDRPDVARGVTVEPSGVNPMELQLSQRVPQFVDLKIKGPYEVVIHAPTPPIKFSFLLRKLADLLIRFSRNCAHHIVL